jgi:hypothetical protein
MLLLLAQACSPKVCWSAAVAVLNESTDNSGVFRDVVEVPDRTLLQRSPRGLTQELLVTQVRCD